MNIVIATDNNFVQHCCVTMTSVLMHNENVVFYLFTEGLTDFNSKLLTDHVIGLGGVLHICKVDSDIVSRFPMPSFMSSHISIATYYRLFSAEILPPSIDKVIYLDCDIVVEGSLLPLWNMDIEKYALAAVFQSHQHNMESYKRLNISPEVGYFNAGVLLINVLYWRQNGVTQRFMDYVRYNFKLIHAHDQDVLNATLCKETLVIDYIWNYRECFFDGKKYDYPQRVRYNMCNKKPVIIHFVSKPKPWDYACMHPYRKLYYKYLNGTPFRNYKPRFSLNAIYNYIIKPFIVKIDLFNLRYLFLKK